MSLKFYEEVTRRLRAGRRIALATVIARQGSAPRAAGARMIVEASGAIAFSIGGGAFEALVIEDAKEALRRGCGFEREYRFTESGEHATGMVCGGSVRVLVEIVEPPARLLIFGAGHVGAALARIAPGLGFHLTVLDDRPRELAALPDGVERVQVPPGFEGDLPEVPAGAFVAILTRCHRTDLLAVRHVLAGSVSYVGLIGSRRKVATLRDRAAEAGVAAEALAALKAPIGLPIGAETPEEIAISIAAEMIAVRRTASAPVLREVAPVRSLRSRRARGTGPSAR
jgi:xanthine dehydrogenase accessory factor